MEHRLTTDPRPACGHEDCTSWYSSALNYWVTDCQWTAPALEVTA
ncbi:hypothetical protein [Nocardia brasiliensis]|nr:hypothetical protein [Nocardia brasiliensis]